MQVPFLSLKDVTKKYASELHEAVNRVVDSGWYLQGSENKQFEKDYAHYIGTKYCVGVANGLQALELMIRSYKMLKGWQDGDEIIVQANTYIATILSISQNNLKPVLVEPNEKTLALDIESIEKAITKKTRALMIVHLYGRCLYNEKIADLCKKHNLKLFEDNAQAHGCAFGEKKTGSFGDAAAHSFYPGKNLGAFGDAGAVTTDNEEVADLVRTLANYGSSKKYVFDYIGENSRLSELDAAVLDVKLRHLDDDNNRRKQIAKMYYGGIKNPLIKMPSELPFEQNVFHIFPVFTERRDELQDYLKNHEIGTIIHYPIPPHKQQAYKEWNNFSFPVTEKIHNEELSLPMSPTLTDTQVQYVINTINAWEA
ncbi:MAG: DegT/DnrJ/EryC1/StrS family aminotransferase [Treponema sp.]|uniref:DegT/DnrJ/EryC1/StrS family aminotransferase n=1 Tax=Treponema sp. TaxID=166 RepID=UPI0025CC5443|nr:DegT/DnrJ/EryC1/StrS family aminotransferase [Treponema sp.]MBQ8679069.1 DegT/DnrJ/EryC1/StrS family aminotransferase [Treponema sp.]